MNEAMKQVVLDVHNHTAIQQARIEKMISAQIVVRDLAAMFEDQDGIAVGLPSAMDITEQDFGEPLPLLYAAAAILEQAYVCICAEPDTSDIIRFYEKRYNELTAPGANIK